MVHHPPWVMLTPFRMSHIRFRKHSSTFINEPFECETHNGPHRVAATNLLWRHFRPISEPRAIADGPHKYVMPIPSTLFPHCVPLLHTNGSGQLVSHLRFYKRKIFLWITFLDGWRNRHRVELTKRKNTPKITHDYIDIKRIPPLPSPSGCSDSK